MKKSGAAIMEEARAAREKRENVAPWIKPALAVYRTTKSNAQAQNAQRIIGVHSRMTEAERDALPEFVHEDIEIVSNLRAHSRAEVVAELQELLKFEGRDAWDGGYKAALRQAIEKIQED